MADERIVWGEGPSNARVIILGQNPGPDEMTEGRPFVGGSGRVLNRALQNVGLARSRCYITNVVKHYVAPGRPVPPALILQDKPLLDRELESLNEATTIVTLGKEAFDSLTGLDLKTRHNRKSAEKNPRAWLRGCPYKMGRYWVLPCAHPSFVMRTGFMESPLFNVDLERARRFNEGQTPPDEHYTNNPSDSEVREYVNECIAAKECGLDIETPESTVDDDELDPLYQTPIELVGLSANLGEAIGVRPDQLDLLRPLLDRDNASDKVTIWGHNSGAFDFYHLGKRFSFKGVRRADCMLGMHLLWSHLTNKDAATCFSIFCDIPYYKNTRLLKPDFYNTIGNCRDTYGALWAGRSMLREMRRYPGMELLFWNHLMPLCDLVNEWRVKGVRIDVDKADRIYLTLMKTLQVYEKWWDQNIPQYSWSSPKQLIELFRSMGLPIYKRKRQKKDEDGNKSVGYTETVDDEALEIYVKKGNKTANLVQQMRTLKHAGDFVCLAKQDGRVHPRFKLHGQVGGRIQAVDGNVQTIPEELSGTYPRSTIIPDDPGNQVIIVADFSQIEYRLYVTQANDKCGIEQVNSGDYLYGFFYEDIFQKPFFIQGLPRTKSNIRPDVQPWELLVAKSWPLGFIYGRGVPDPTGLPISKTKCGQIYSDFHLQHSAISIFHTDLIFRATQTGLLVSPYGRMRLFPNPKGARNEILAFPGQTVAVDVLIRNALLPLPENLKRFNGRVMFSVHDSVVCCVDKKFIREAEEVIKSCMQAPLPELNGLIIPVETKIGPNWYDLTRTEKYFGAIADRTVGTIPGVIAG